MLEMGIARCVCFGALLIWCEIAAVGQNSVYDSIFVNPNDERIVIERGTQVPAIVIGEMSSKPDSTFEVVVASDVVSKGVVVIQRGEHVQFSDFVNPQKRLGPDGTLTRCS